MKYVFKRDHIFITYYNIVVIILLTYYSTGMIIYFKIVDLFA